MITIKHIIVACAVDTISAYTVRYAIEFSKVLNSKLTILHRYIKVKGTDKNRIIQRK
jgi:hypothetical protein